MIKKRPTSPEGHRQVSSPDGAVTFILKRTKAGVHVERRHEVKGPSQQRFASIQALFTTEEEFERFCEADTVRFDYPLTHEQLRREFNGLIEFVHP